MFNMASKIFEEELTQLINNCGLTVSEAYYIVENASLRLKLLLNEMIMKEQMFPQSFEQEHKAHFNVEEKVEEQISKQEEASE